MTNPQTGINFSTDEESMWGAANEVPAPTQSLGAAPKASAYSCDMLGVCQQRAQRCKGCTAEPLRLAPGVLEGYRAPLFGNKTQRRELVRLLAVSVAVVAVVVLVSGAAGYMWAVSK